MARLRMLSFQGSGVSRFRNKGRIGLLHASETMDSVAPKMRPAISYARYTIHPLRYSSTFQGYFRLPRTH